MDTFWEIVQKANTICGILSLLVSVIALYKVSEIQKQVSNRNRMTQKAVAKGSAKIEQTQRGGGDDTKP